MDGYEKTLLQKLTERGCGSHTNFWNPLSTAGLFKDYSAQIHCIRDGWEDVVGPEGTGHLTDNGEILLNSVCSNQAQSGGSLFRQRNLQ